MEKPLIPEHLVEAFRIFPSRGWEYRWHAPAAVGPMGSGRTIAEEILQTPHSVGLRSDARIFTSRAEFRRGH